MTKHTFELLKAGKYNPFGYTYVYYLETFKPVYVPAYLATDEDCWFGPNNSHTHKRVIVNAKYTTIVHQICGDDMCSNVPKISFNNDDIIFTITPRETVQIKKDDGTYDYITRYLPAFTVTTNYKNIKRFAR